MFSGCFLFVWVLLGFFLFFMWVLVGFFLLRIDLAAEKG
ncbi:putative membrane protein [Escherichia coli 8-415-05_S1_C2]|nr:putative membrane protein [Escherichia coli 8-415-05_S1_C2]